MIFSLVGFQETLTSLRLCLWNQHPRALAAGKGGKVGGAEKGALLKEGSNPEGQSCRSCRRRRTLDTGRRCCVVEKNLRVQRY